MFYLVPARRAEREFIQRRDMPKKIGGGEGGAGEERMEEYPSNALHRFPDKKGTQNISREPTRETGEYRKIGRPRQNQRRSQHQQQQVLNHVYLQQQSSEGVQRRRNRDEECRQSAGECQKAPNRKAIRYLELEAQPAKEIKCQRKEYSEAWNYRYRPRAEYCVCWIAHLTAALAYRFRFAPLLAPLRREILLATNGILFRRQHTTIHEKPNHLQMSQVFPICALITSWLCFSRIL